MYKLLIALVFISTSVLTAQSNPNSLIHVKGTVLDSNGDPVKRAIIYVDSVKTFTKTNKRGFYTIDVPSDTGQMMAFSSKYGMVAGLLEGDELNFQFQKDQPKISENELKQIGFTVDTNRKRRVDPSDYENYSSIYDLIKAMFTGVTVRGSDIRVRGYSSLPTDSGDLNSLGANPSEPLVVVDGNYVSSTALNQFLPKDVESIELLKDSDAAIYGARGATGVFIITLKK
ncbi:TonB-dependent receptor plug domain-containing protein [Flavobacteriaceae bacterium F89]|uniref:TonB-dependent receptor plug domain-containing protein n=1 Tax=Cerina litoralis TaxID=2874477 RepID=A0AAE3JQI8_9FLAO|nr:TonB-dependent receptor plug domain-containing protein [Cerina litoralis]MCG2462151.1 TonB-dependent receptor plug domain-containing protein [Cerina litoralis]